MLSWFVVVTCVQADTVTSADVFLLSGPSASQSGTTASSAFIDSNNFANAVINPAAGTMGVEAVSGLSNRADATASHGDIWSCLGPACNTISVAPISLGLFLDGSATLGPSNDAHLEASYQISTIEGFKFIFDQADGGFGASASYFSPSGTIVSVPVTLNQTTDAQGNDIVNFSVDYSITTGMPSGCSSTPDHPCPFSAGDLQGFNAFTNGGAVMALHTFGVTITSLDPNIQLTSADGRTGTAPVPEPTTLAMLATSLAVLAVRLRRGSPSV